MSVLYSIVCAAAAALGLAAVWVSGRDVGYRNAMRECALLHDEQEVLYRPEDHP